MSENRKLAAIVFTDIVGFTQLMNQNENTAMELLETQRKLLRPIIESFDGEWLKEIGDGLLFSFPSAVKAVTCALEIQRILEHNPKLTIRIGIHIGDVIQKDGDVFGDGVNIASRLEPLAEPGGICVSERVYDDIRNKPEINAKFQDKRMLKGVEHPIKVYSIFIKMGVIDEKPRKPFKQLAKSNFINIIGISAIVIILILIYYFLQNESPEIKINPKSVAVLPFDNYSSAEEDQYFSDGLTEVIIANLAKIKDLKVISRTSVMQYKGTTKPLKEIGKELGVAHILEGSVQRAGNIVRIVGQLIDTETDQHLWAETYDEDISSIFQVQSEIAQSIALSLKSEITNAEKELINEKLTDNPKAYDFYLMAKDLSHRDKSDIELAIDLLKKAVYLDTNFVSAIAEISIRYSASIHFGIDVSENAISSAENYYLKAISKNPNSLSALRARGVYFYWAQKNYALALEDFNKILSIEPGNSMNHELIGYVQRRIGRWDEALKTLEYVKVLNPNYGYINIELYTTYYTMKLYDKGDALADELLKFYPNDAKSYFALATKEFRRTENIEDEERIIKEASDKLGEWRFAEYWWWNNLRKGEFDKIIEITEGFNEISYNQLKISLRPGIFSFLYKEKGDEVLAQKYFIEEKKLIDIEMNKNPNDPRIHRALGRYYAKVGDLENSIKFHENAINLYPRSKDAWASSQYKVAFAQSMGIIGNSKKAIELLEEIFEFPADIHWWTLKYHHFFKNVRGDKKFQDFIEKQKMNSKIG